MHRAFPVPQGPRNGRAVLATLLAAAAAVSASTLAAQESGPPAGWVVRTDRGGHGGGAAPEFAAMSPGWHITTGPAAIFFDPSTTAAGRFRAEAEIFLFDPGARNEGFGLFIGGTDLEGDGQAYTYFLIRRDGSTLIKRRDGGETATLQGWTPAEAVTTWDERAAGEGTVKNVLAIEATPTELVFLVNGAEVFRTGREGQHADGIVGLRVNHGLDLHVASLRVTPGS